ncbi:MAG TPA: MATE family efflux transporter [Bacteroidetes bacterium]|nr:MATE family efflux transporter [Bacteroidota bacterium]
MKSATSDPLTQSILDDDIWKLLRQLSLPAIIGMSINGINAFFDGLFIGQFTGQDALAAISIAFPLVFITGGMSAMIGVGGSSILSMAIGEGDKEKSSKVFGNVTALAGIVSAALMFFGIYFARDLISMLGGEGDILEMGVTYYRITLYGAFFRIYAVDLNMLIRAEGKIKEAMSHSISAAVLNIVLNYIFVGKLNMGVAGAAWATVISMGIFTLIGTYYFFNKKTNYFVDLKTYSPEKKIAVPILKIGVSAMMLQLMFFVQQSVVYKMIDIYGTDWDIALMGASYRILLLMLFPGFGFAMAMQPVVGINFGAKNMARVKSAFKIFTLSSSFLITFCWALIMLFPSTVLGWMLPDADFTANDIMNFRMMMVALPLYPLFFMSTTMFQAIGKAKMAGLLTIMRDLLLFIPAVIVLPVFFGVNGVFYGGVPSNVIMLAICVWVLWRLFGKWEKETGWTAKI